MKLELDGEIVYCDQYNADAPDALLLVHGLGGTANFWAPVVAAFASTHRILAPDLPGAGRSPLASPPSFESLARVLLALLDALGIARARVAGHSMGSILCQHLAALAPERVRDLVLLGPLAELPDAARPLLEARAATALGQGMEPIAAAVCERGLSAETRDTRPVVTGFVREMLLRQPPAGYAAHCRALATGRRADPATMRCPTLLVSGHEDTTAPPASVEALAAELPRADVELLNACGHWTAVEKPVETVAAMRRFYGAGA
ncbi:MAG: alpha/beta fold hydrolase [Gammaproteobacteria bacterium]